MEFDQWSPAVRICQHRVRPSPRPKTEYSSVTAIVVLDAYRSSPAVKSSFLLASNLEVSVYATAAIKLHFMDDFFRYWRPNPQPPLKACLITVRNSFDDLLVSDSGSSRSSHW